jgi:hypothetical protein
LNLNGIVSVGKAWSPALATFVGPVFYGSCELTSRGVPAAPPRDCPRRTRQQPLLSSGRSPAPRPNHRRHCHVQLADGQIRIFLRSLPVVLVPGKISSLTSGSSAVSSPDSDGLPIDRGRSRLPGTQSDVPHAMRGRHQQQGFEASPRASSWQAIRPSKPTTVGTAQLFDGQRGESASASQPTVRRKFACTQHPNAGELISASSGRRPQFT